MVFTPQHRLLVFTLHCVNYIKYVNIDLIIVLMSRSPFTKWHSLFIRQTPPHTSKSLAQAHICYPTRFTDNLSLSLFSSPLDSCKFGCQHPKQPGHHTFSSTKHHSSTSGVSALTVSSCCLIGWLSSCISYPLLSHLVGVGAHDGHSHATRDCLEGFLAQDNQTTDTAPMHAPIPNLIATFSLSRLLLLTFSTHFDHPSLYRSIVCDTSLGNPQTILNWFSMFSVQWTLNYRESRQRLSRLHGVHHGNSSADQERWAVCPW